MTAKVFPCNICGRVLKQLTHWRDHQSTHSDARNYKCSVCTSVFKTRGAMRFHYRKRHTLTQFYACISAMDSQEIIPRKPQAQKIALKIKQKAMKRKKKSQSATPTASVTLNYNNRPRKCTICDFVIRHGRNFKKHMMRHDESNVECPHKECGMRFVWRKALAQHLETNHGEKRAKQNELNVTTRSKVVKVEEEKSDESQNESKLRISSCYSLTSDENGEVEKKQSYRYECVECSIGFDDNDALWKHLFAIHLNQEEKSAGSGGNSKSQQAKKTTRGRRTS